MDLIKWAEAILKKYSTSTIPDKDELDEWSGVENAVDVLEIAMAVKELRTENEALKEANRWIPVEERMPEEREDAVPFRSEAVFVTNGITARIAYWMTRQKYWRFDGSGWGNPITHWKPIILPQALLA